jgi:integrase
VELDGWSEPPLTEARMRNSFLAQIVEIGGLDLLLAGMVSGSWRFSLRTPLFYTTLSKRMLAQRYRQAVQNLWEQYRVYAPELAPWPETVKAEAPSGYQGSPYLPQQKVMKRVVETLQEMASQEPDLEVRHNAKTLLVLYGLSILCGLRISTAGRLQAGQFDIRATWQGQPMPWLVLDSTKGNRFTSAARIVPLPGILLPLLAELLPDESSGNAFYFNSNGERHPADRQSIIAQLKTLHMPFPRWHAGRHLLRSHLMEREMAFDEINAILGHQSAGRELFNPYLPTDVFGCWSKYKTLAGDLADNLGFHGGGHAS